MTGIAAKLREDVAPLLDSTRAERELTSLFTCDDLHQRRRLDGSLTRTLDETVDAALSIAYGASPEAEAERFLQRVLYRLNRMMLFWYDDLRSYQNERSPYLLDLRTRIEAAWQAWELLPHNLVALQRESVPQGLRARADRDVDAPPSPAGRYFRDTASLPAYRRLLEIASLDALVEASQLSRTLGGVTNGVHATLTRLLLEEYGGGRPARKHSAYFRGMLASLDMKAEPEAYFVVVPCAVLAGINQSFLLSDRKRFFLRYIGGLLYTEVSVPAAFRCYRAAGERLGLPAKAMAYWEIHIKEDARHGPWMLNDVALPLAERYPDDAWELLLGYDQQYALSARAGAATARAAGEAE